MGESFKKVRIIFVVGPTATGKSDLAVELAEEFDGEIINADSIQFYKEIEVGTAKPGPDLLKRVPHHLISFVDPPKTLSAGDFTRAVEKVLNERISVGIKTFIIVGGSGFYIQALEKGMIEAPKIDEQIRERVRQQFESEGSEQMWIEIEKRDPTYAAKISKNDSYRVQRGLEILLSGTKLISEAQSEFANQESQFRKSYEVRKIGIECDREILRQRVTRRTEQMLAGGWSEEVRSLRARGFEDWPPMKSVGYFEIGEWIDSKIKESELQERIITSTMQLAKKQRTWFRRDTEIDWVAGDVFALSLTHLQKK